MAANIAILGLFAFPLKSLTNLKSLLKERLGFLQALRLAHIYKF
ncbi:hypothetical protein SAMN05444277_107172 [Parafilimonas terrae]|jgi:hypothetical protein|uniref:Uncharacterized protein n=1 Tax=Parafilimonas terrae TaxID=1465490 RepID=A0A1I5X3U5_9BACT|nr:hypothetical protein SAMN05444277_107172 [Parafilimonas terrae]